MVERRVSRSTLRADTIRLVRRFLKEAHGATLRPSRSRLDQPCYQASISLAERRWTLVVAAPVDDESVDVELFRAAPRCWSNSGFSECATTTVCLDLQLDFVTRSNIIGVCTGIPIEWDWGAVGQRLEMLTEGATLLWADVEYGEPLPITAKQLAFSGM